MSSIAFQCPACHSTRSAHESLIGRRVRCPECDELVEVIPLPPDEVGGRGTVMLQPPEATGGETVMLEAVDVVPPGQAPQPDSGGPPRVPPAKAPPAEDEDPPPKVKKSQLVETEMDMTPMVDATFQLLIFFMITAAFALQKSKEIPKPKSDEPSTAAVVSEEDATPAVVVKVDQLNTYLVINSDGDEEEAPSIPDLHTKLRKARDSDSSGKSPTKLRVEAHDDSLHERVIAALDAGNATGFAEIELTSLEDDG